MRKVMSEILPTFSSFGPAEMGRGAGVDDFFFELIRGRDRATVGQLIAEVREFDRAPDERKTELISGEIAQIIKENKTWLY